MLQRILVLIAIAASTALAQQPTARQIVDQIKANIGVPWQAQTVDTFKAGDPDTPVTGIAVTMMATYDVLQRAAAEGKNLVITHEPTFYSHLDRTEALESAHDPVYQQKAQFIRDHHMVVFRFHDHWHMRKPDGVMEGVLRYLGWEKLYSYDKGIATIPPTTLEVLAADVQKKLGAKVLRAVGPRDMKVARVALSPGAGGPASHMPALRRDDVDVLIIGEVPEWETIEWVADAAAEGRRKALLLVGHIPSEQPGMDNCAGWLKTFVKSVPIAFVPAVEPFWTPR